MQEFVDEFALHDFAQIADATARVWRMFKVTSQPAYVFINDSGGIKLESGAFEVDALTARIQELVDT